MEKSIHSLWSTCTVHLAGPNGPNLENIKISTYLQSIYVDVTFKRDYINAK